ncbi:MAG: hypothetical protein M3162_04595 [Thermoproteota archaeon]|nr:hypothetical protein [Thermoproteota archaeon]
MFIELRKKLNRLEDFVENIHKLGYSLVNYNNLTIPCLVVEQSFFDTVLNVSYAKKTSVDVNLNIYDDGKKVFVDISLKFLKTSLENDFLLFANESMNFFKSLSESGMLGLLPQNRNQENVFFIQLPRKETAKRALRIIEEKLGQRPL